MTSWHAKNLGDPLLACEELTEIKAKFTSMYSGMNADHNVAIFLRHESEGRLQCELILYFSPGTEVLAKSVGAIPSNPPSRHDLSVLAGSTNLAPFLI